MRHLEHTIDLSVHVVRSGCLADLQDPAIGRGQHDGRDLVGRQLPPQRGPRRMAPLVETPLLDGHEEMVGEHAEEDVGLHAVLEVVEDRALHQGSLQGAKRGLDPREQDVEAPDLVVREVVPIGLEQVVPSRALAAVFFSVCSVQRTAAAAAS